MSRFFQDNYTPINPDKYVGKTPIFFRSSWEQKCMETFDKHPGVIAWSSESIRIQYMNPFTNKSTYYVPDFVIVYQDKNKIQHTEILEVKPAKETFFELAKTERAKNVVTLNMAKWDACARFAKDRGWSFRIINENDIFNNPGKK